MTSPGMVRRVAGRALAVEAPERLVASHGVAALERRECVLVEVETADGTIGYGESVSFGVAPQTVLGFIRTEVAPSILGRIVHDAVRICQEYHRLCRQRGRGGLASRAISGIDGALWDAAAKRLGVPLRWLFGSTAESVLAYASSGFYSSQDRSTETLMSQLSALVAAGYRAVKIKIGREGLEDDLRRATAAREAVGKEVVLLVDANAGYSRPQDALRLARGLEELRVEWLEEPFDVADEPAYRWLCARSPVPIAAGESASTLADLRRLIGLGVEVLQPDVGWCGGLTTVVSAAKMVEMYYRTFAPHSFSSPVNLLLAAQVVAAVEGSLLEVDCTVNPFMLDLAREDWSRRLIDGGRLALPDAGGSGFRPRHDVLEAVTVERFESVL